MKHKAPASYLHSAAVAALMMCFCIPVIGHAQVINFPAPARRGEDFRILLRAPPTSPATPDWAPQEAPEQRMNYVIAGIAFDGPGFVSPDKPSDRRAEEQQPLPSVPETLPPGDNAGSAGQAGAERGFGWGVAIRQSLLFTGVMHGFRLATEPGSRAELRGPFFRDYFRSVRNLRGWGDGDPFLVNYIGHPMQGAVSGYIQIHNDPRGIGQEFGMRKSYWKSRIKAMSWAAVVSTQFELGPFSEASLGNVGLKPSEKSQHPMGFVDLVTTPTAGAGWLVMEDMIDRFIVQRFENKFSNRVMRGLVRSFLNPTRSFANIMRFEHPWRREGRPL
jgi:hypothetical protein